MMTKLTTIFALLGFVLAFHSASGFAPFATKTPQANKQDVILDELLTLSRKIGPVGSLASEESRNELNEIAQKLTKIKGDPNPAKAPLRGIHNLVYSAAPGGSSGRLFGPFYGKVTQEFFEDDKTFINSVKIGPIEISLQAEKRIKDGKTNVVKFLKSKVSVFGNTVLDKDIKGGGTWKYLYMGEYEDSNGQKKLLRVMETPSLFIIEQPISR